MLLFHQMALLLQGKAYTAPSARIVDFDFFPAASGGGDCLVRFWDTTTNTPRATCKGHRHHVLCTAWAPDGARFASADKIGEIRVWDPRKGVETCKPLKGHKSWVTSLAFEPFHRNPNCERLASASKDKTVRIWNVRTGRFEFSLSVIPLCRNSLTYFLIAVWVAGPHGFSGVCEMGRRRINLHSFKR